MSEPLPWKPASKAMKKLIAAERAAEARRRRGREVEVRVFESTDAGLILTGVKLREE